MSANKRPRKKYRPRVIDLAATANAIEGASLLAPAQVAQAIAGLHASLLDFQRGIEPVWHLRVLSDMCNVAEQLIERGICTDAESRSIVSDAQTCIARLCEQHAESGSWTARAGELATLRDAVERHGIQLQHACMSEYQAAIAAVVRIVSQALAGNAGRSVVNVGHISS